MQPGERFWQQLFRRWWVARTDGGRAEPALIAFLSVMIAFIEGGLGIAFASGAHGVWRAALVALVPGFVLLVYAVWLSVRALLGMVPLDRSSDAWPYLVYGSLVLLFGGVICFIAAGVS